MTEADMRIRSLEERIFRLEGEANARQAIIAAIGRTLVQTDINSVDDIERKIRNWERYFEPAFTVELPSDHSDLDVIKLQAFMMTLRNFFQQVRDALPEGHSTSANS